jgi:hypothetical protein
MKLTSTLGGLAGAAALTFLNQTAKNMTADAPRLDLLGQNALAKLMKGNDMLSKTTKEFFPLAGDLISNSLFYGMARGTSPGNTMMRGALLGVGAGLGALTLPKTMGLDEQATNKTTQTKVMTVAWYLLGGLVAAAVINALDGYKKDQPDELKETAIQKGKQAAKSVVKELAHTI